MRIHNEFPPRWEDFLKALTDRLSKTNSKLPSVRCLTKKTLSYMFREIQNDLNLPSTYPSGVKILELLVSMGLAARIPLEDIPKITPSLEFYLLGIRESHSLDVDPLELLQAYNQSGIICYFSALGFLKLTTQINVHHHIAIPIRQNMNSAIHRLTTVPKKLSTPIISGRSRLGTHIFSFYGTPFFSTKRFRNTMPGIKIRVLSPRSHLRMTTIEQTLLDTLQFPFHCGGPETVLEAWEKGIEIIDQEQICTYLKKINIAPLIRRTGAVFDLLGHKPGKKLGTLFKQARAGFLGKGEYQLIPLLKGINYSRINSVWNVAIP